MKFFKSTFCFLVFCSVLGSLVSFAQNTMSPYSIFGPGEILNKGFGRNIGMGRAGIAVQSDNHLNNLNPASYTGIEKEHVIFEIGVDSKYSGFKSSEDKMDGLNGNLSYLAMAFRYTSWLSASIGLSPYSSVGYNINTQNSMEGSLLDYTSSFTGSGGITLAYWSNSLKVSDNLSLGLNTSFLFGPITQDENLYQGSYGINYTVSQNDYLSSAYLDFGLQYSLKIKKLDYSFGLTYANKQSLNSVHTLTVLDANLSTLYAEEEKIANVTIPETAGLGISIKNTDKYVFVADYRTEKWKGLKYPTMSGDFVNSHSFSAGAEFRPWIRSVTNIFYKNWLYRVGLTYNSSYLKLRNKVINEYAMTFGVGVPLRNNESTMNIAIEAGTGGTQDNNLVKENYLLLHLNFSINELWFIKQKYY